MRQPFKFYVDSYNLVGKSRKKAAFRFSKDSWEALMQYRQWEIEEAVEKALALPKFELLKEASKMKLECVKHAGTVAGQAFRDFQCGDCKGRGIWPNTAIPRFCRMCAFRGFKCMMCGDPLTEQNYIIIT